MLVVSHGKVSFPLWTLMIIMDHYELDQLICPLKTFLFDMFVTSDF